MHISDFFQLYTSNASYFNTYNLNMSMFFFIIKVISIDRLTDNIHSLTYTQYVHVINLLRVG